jgi:hypothetical protein
MSIRHLVRLSVLAAVPLLAGCISALPGLAETPTAIATMAATATVSLEIQECFHQALGWPSALSWQVEEITDAMVVFRVKEGETPELARARCTPGAGFGWYVDTTLITVIRAGGRCDEVSRETVGHFSGEGECDNVIPTASSTAAASESSSERRVKDTTSTPRPTSTPAFWPTGIPPPTRGPAAVERNRPMDESVCIRLGGTWSAFMCAGRFDALGCYRVPTSDAGRPCSDDSECQGWCDPNLTEATMREEWARRGQTAAPLPITGTCSRIAWPHTGDMPTSVEDGIAIMHPRDMECQS